MLTGSGTSISAQPLQERHRGQKRPLLLGAQLGRDRGGEPVFAAASLFEHALAAFLRELDLVASSVSGVGAPLDQARRLELGEGLRHRLRADVLGRRERARRLRAFAVEPAEDGRLRDRERVLRPEPPDELAEHQPELAGAVDDLRRGMRHAEIVDR